MFTLEFQQIFFLYFFTRCFNFIDDKFYVFCRLHEIEQHLKLIKKFNKTLSRCQNKSELRKRNKKTCREKHRYFRRENVNKLQNLSTQNVESKVKEVFLMFNLSFVEEIKYKS